MSYQRIDQLSNQTARALIALGVKRGNPVAGVPDEILGQAVEAGLTLWDRVQISKNRDVILKMPSSKINRHELRMPVETKL